MEYIPGCYYQANCYLMRGSQILAIIFFLLFFEILRRYKSVGKDLKTPCRLMKSYGWSTSTELLLFWDKFQKQVTAPTKLEEQLQKRRWNYELTVEIYSPCNTDFLYWQLYLINYVLLKVQVYDYIEKRRFHLISTSYIFSTRALLGGLFKPRIALVEKVVFRKN